MLRGEKWSFINVQLKSQNIGKRRRQNQEKEQRQQMIKHVVDINLTISIITLNVNDLNVSIKK